MPNKADSTKAWFISININIKKGQKEDQAG